MCCHSEEPGQAGETGQEESRGVERETPRPGLRSNNPVAQARPGAEQLGSCPAEQGWGTCAHQAECGPAARPCWDAKVASGLLGCNRQPRGEPALCSKASSLPHLSYGARKWWKKVTFSLGVRFGKCGKENQQRNVWFMKQKKSTQTTCNAPANSIEHKHRHNSYWLRSSSISQCILLGPRSLSKNGLLNCA